jgi:CubicO group peptidase (beta-lactamase class C family)
MPGLVAPGFERVGEAFHAAQADDSGGAQLCVYQQGGIVVDLWAGRDYGPDTLAVLMSCTKAVVALCVHRLAEQGRLDVEAPIARHWPEFAAAGKADVTLAHVLSHSAGLPGFDPAAGVDVDAMLDFERCASALAAQAPLWRPGGAFAYHAITYGYLVGEVVRRATGQSIGAWFDAEIARPLGLDLWIGLPEVQEGRVAEHFRPAPAGGAAGWRALFAGAGMDVETPTIRAFIEMFTVTDGLIDVMNQRP